MENEETAEAPNENLTEEVSEQQEDVAEETEKVEEKNEPEELPIEKEVGESQEADEQEDLSKQIDSQFQWLYDELNNKEFIFSSGAGAWRTGFMFTEDGKFSGTYSDADGSDMVVSDFEGQFIILEEMDEVTYRLKLEEFDIISETGREEMVGDMHITYVDSVHGFQLGSDIFELYLPFKPKSEVSFMYLSWVYGQANNDYEFLNTFGLYNLTHEFGMEEVIN